MEFIILQVEGNDVKNDAITRIPDEMWEELFSYISVEGIIRLLEMRLVCRKWRAVIDDNFHLHVIILNDMEYHPTLVYGLLATDCVVKSLVKELPPNVPLFRENCLNSLKIWGSITPANFQALISRQFANLETLSFNQAALSIPDLMLKRTSEEQDSFYGIFAASVKTLVLDAQGFIIRGKGQTCML